MTHALLRPQYLPSAALRSAVVRRVALAWLLLALVVVPTLGRLHQVVHGGALDQAHAGLLAAPSSLPGQTAWDPAPNARSAATTGHSLWLPSAVRPNVCSDVHREISALSGHLRMVSLPISI